MSKETDFDVLLKGLQELGKNQILMNNTLMKIFELLSDRSKEVFEKEITSEHVSGINLEDKPNFNFVIPMKNAKFTWYRFADQDGRVRKCENEGCDLFLKYNENKKTYEHWKFDPNTGKGGYVADKCEWIYSA